MTKNKVLSNNFSVPLHKVCISKVLGQTAHLSNFNWGYIWFFDGFVIVCNGQIFIKQSLDLYPLDAPVRDWLVNKKIYWKEFRDLLQQKHLFLLGDKLHTSNDYTEKAVPVEFQDCKKSDCYNYDILFTLKLNPIKTIAFSVENYKLLTECLYCPHKHMILIHNFTSYSTGVTVTVNGIEENEQVALFMPCNLDALP